MSIAAAIKPKRRWLQFSLRTMLIVVTLIAVACGYLAPQFEQQRLVKALEKMGVWVTYDYACGDLAQDVDRPTTQSASIFGLSLAYNKPGPKWLRNWLGDDFFAKVRVVMVGRDVNVDEALLLIARLPFLREIDFSNVVLSDGDLLLLGRLNHLRGLTMDGMEISDNGFANVGRMSGLKRLTLIGCIIDCPQPLQYLSTLPELESLQIEPADGLTDVDLQNLRMFRALNSLRLSSPDITDVGMSSIAELNTLATLALPHCTGVADKGLELLAKLASLKSLNLRGTRIKGRGLAHLNDLPALADLDLSLTPLDDEGFAQAQFPDSLVEIKLDGTWITDAGLQPLESLPNLDRVSVKGCKVSEDGLTRLAGHLKRGLDAIDSDFPTWTGTRSNESAAP